MNTFYKTSLNKNRQFCLLKLINWNKCVKMLIKIFEKLSKESTMYPRKKDSAEKLMMVSKYSDLADPTLADNWVV